MDPGTGVPGGPTVAYGLGFGAIPANAPKGPNGLIGVGQTTQANGFGVVLVK
jgi:hypothetical protein